MARARPPCFAGICQRKNPKVYLFDLGVASALRHELSLPVLPGNWAYGRAFEAFIILEVSRLNHYHRLDWRLSYVRTKDNVELDLIIERPGKKRALVEIKSTDSVSKDDVRSFSLAKDLPNSECLCLSRDPTPQVLGDVRCLHWMDGLAELGLPT